ncbi:cytochrome-c oxidase, cbb3-type subunit III [Pseudomonas japonica]|uniref:cytochrome-c oxidase, cbb3-type subunit III n=1 Tax=Pseudomonas japonica TaxID=256466 RepID=UPI0015E284E2|nr:cytochrome-c oxidase, cbb3-type subunit III [Pseudomonas japonica]MBA1287334.1 cytochrome-c oxidase, cbb3-type subunit III [Pseudomonas japonica]
MSSFWSLYISVFTLGTLAALGVLLWTTRHGRGSVEHERFDGIEEHDNPLPHWWRWLFIATLVFAALYLALYPGLGNWRGLLGWTSAGQWQAEQAQARQTYGPLYARFKAMPIEAIAKDAPALAMGARLFASNCALCHGADGKGAPGYPDLTDSLWRWGAGPAALVVSIGQGRTGVMPAWGAVLGDQGTRDVAAYVLQLNGRPVPNGEAANAANGAARYAQGCVACHGPAGRGNPLVGAPDLTQAQGFIYGPGFEDVRRSIHEGRQGHMPAQAQLLGDDRVRVLAAYVYSLAQPAPPPSDTEPAP